MQGAMKDVQVPSSVPQLTTKNVLTMSFIEGKPITRLRVRHHMPQLSACPVTSCIMIPKLGRLDTAGGELAAGLPLQIHWDNVNSTAGHFHSMG